MQTRDTHTCPDWPQVLHNVLQNRQLNNLQQIMRHAERLLLINNILRGHLREPLSDHCQVMQYTTTELTIAVDSAAWLTQLRFLVPTLLPQLQQHPQLMHLTEISLRINPIQGEPPPHIPPHPRYLSSHNKHMLNELATHINNDELSRALQRLAR